MKPRERVLKAFKKLHGLPDRVPVQFDLCRSLLEHFSKKLNIPVRYTHNLWEDVTYRISGNEIRTALGSDVVVTGAGSAKEFEIKKDKNGRWLNEYGMLMKQGDIYVEPVEFPLANVQSLSDLKDFELPDPSAQGRYDDAKELVNKYKDDYVIVADIELTIFELPVMLIGMEKLLMDLALDAEYIKPLYDMCTDFQIEVGRNLIECGVDVIWAGDDFGGQTSLLISPDCFRKQLKGYYARMVNSFKAANPDIINVIHSDGAISPLLPDFIELGFDVLNPVQPGVPGHGPKDLKDGFGDKICFWGGIDQQQLLPNGTDQELEEEIKTWISIMGKDRGYVIAPAHIIQSDVSGERVEKFVKLCRKHGRYN